MTTAKITVELPEEHVELLKALAALHRVPVDRYLSYELASTLRGIGNSDGWVDWKIVRERFHLK